MVQKTTGKTRAKNISSSRINWFQHFLIWWFDDNGRDFYWRAEEISGYKLLVTEMLLQRTTATAVAKFADGFFQEFPSFESLAYARTQELQAALRPLGIYVSRAKNLKAIGEKICAIGGEIPCNRDELEKLPGVGQYIANAVLALHCGQREPLIDNNMVRVLERFFGSRERSDFQNDPYVQHLAQRVVNHRYCRRVNFGILDLAWKTCRIRNPKCGCCPLRSRCNFLKRYRR